MPRALECVLGAVSSGLLVLFHEWVRFKYPHQKHLPLQSIGLLVECEVCRDISSCLARKHQNSWCLGSGSCWNSCCLGSGSCWRLEHLTTAALHTKATQAAAYILLQ